MPVHLRLATRPAPPIRAHDHVRILARLVSVLVSGASHGAAALLDEEEADCSLARRERREPAHPISDTSVFFIANVGGCREQQCNTQRGVFAQQALASWTTSLLFLLFLAAWLDAGQAAIYHGSTSTAGVLVLVPHKSKPGKSGVVLVDLWMIPVWGGGGVGRMFSAWGPPAFPLGSSTDGRGCATEPQSQSPFSSLFFFDSIFSKVSGIFIFPVSAYRRTKAVFRHWLACFLRLPRRHSGQGRAGQGSQCYHDFIARRMATNVGEPGGQFVFQFVLLILPCLGMHRAMVRVVKDPRYCHVDS